VRADESRASPAHGWVEQWSLTTLREKLVKIGARIVRHGRYVVFRLAEVAVPRALFAAILRRIDGLRGPPMVTA
jgi:Transposase DDE domain group 1